jgi:hypothetical protein
MNTYHYKGMDHSGNEVRGFLDAESEYEATVELKEGGLFVTNLSLFALEVTPAWSAVSLGSPDNIPSGRLLAQGLPCTHEERGIAVGGELNVLGLNGELRMVFERPGVVRPALDLPIRAVKQVRQSGLFRKGVTVTTHTGEEHLFRGTVSEIQRLWEWTMFTARKMP